MSAGFWEETMNSELGRSMESTKIFPFMGSREQVDATKSACSSQNLVPVGLGAHLKSSPLRLAILADERCNRCPARSRQMLGDQEPCADDRGGRVVSVEI